MTALYVITAQYQELADKLSNLDLDATTVADSIEASGLMDDFADKSQALEFVARSTTAHNSAIDFEIRRLAALRDKRNKIADGIRDYLKNNMERSGITKVNCPFFDISIKKNPLAVDVIDPLLLPAEYWRPGKPTAATPDKAKIKEAIQAGQEVTGARLVQGTRLDVL